MSKVEKFEDLIAWQKARELTREIYTVTKSGEFKKDFGLRDQIQRACVSIMSNIAEGFDRASRAEFHQFLVVAKGSCAEVRSMLYLAEELRYLEKSAHIKLSDETVEITKILNGLIKSIKPN